MKFLKKLESAKWIIITVFLSLVIASLILWIFFGSCKNTNSNQPIPPMPPIGYEGYGTLTFTSPSGTLTTVPICPKAQAMSRSLWEQHGIRTRDYIVKYLDDHPAQSVSASATTLLQNQEDIGNYVNSVVPGTRDVTTKLLKEHIMIAVDILKDVKEQRSPDADVKRWYQNADTIAQTLAPALKLDVPTLKQMMHNHLETTLQEALLHYQGKTNEESLMVDQVFKHLAIMSDYLISTVKCTCPT